MKKLSEKEKAIHDRFSKYGANAKDWMKKCVLMLPLIESELIWEKKGFGSIFEYAAKIAGMSRYRVKDSLRILRRIADKPALMEVARVKGLNSVRPVVTFATRENDEFWAGKAGEMSRHTLETFAKDFKKEEELRAKKIGTGTGSLANNGTSKPKLFLENGGVVAADVEFNSADNLDIKTDVDSEDKVQLSMKLDPELVEALKKIKGNGDWNEAMKKLLRMQVEKPKPVRSNSRKAPVAVEKYIKMRSGGKCEHPNCEKAGEHIHHTESFALTKMHDPDNMLHLCEAHHKIIHLGYIDDDELRFGIVEQWQQIEKLPDYDIKNLINARVAEFRR